MIPPSDDLIPILGITEVQAMRDDLRKRLVIGTLDKDVDYCLYDLQEHAFVGNSSGAMSHFASRAAARGVRSLIVNGKRRLYYSGVHTHAPFTQGDNIIMGCGSNNTKAEALRPEDYQEPKYKPGDRVKSSQYGVDRGTVIRVKFLYDVQDDDLPGDTTEYDDDEIETLTLGTAEIWTDAVLLIHKLIESGQHEFPNNYSMQVEGDKQIRHKVYQFIGGLGVKVTEDMRGTGGSVQRIIEVIRDQKDN